MTEESDSLPSKEHLPRAFSALRDGRLFICIAVGAAISSYAAFHFEKQHGDLWVAGFLALMCAGVCAVMGFWKYAVADHFGLHTNEAHVGPVALGSMLYVVVVVGIFICFPWFFPWILFTSMENVRSPVFWLIPALCAGLWCFVGKNAFREDLARRSHSFFLLGQICFAHLLVVVIFNDASWFVVGNLLKKSAFWKFEYVGLRLWMLLTSGACLAFFCLGVWNLRLAVRDNVQSPYRRRASGAARLAAALPLTIVCVLIPFQDISEYWAVVAAVWSITFAVGLGERLARLGIDRPPNWWRRAAFIGPLLLMGALLIVPTAGILGAVYPVVEAKHTAWYYRSEWSTRRYWILNYPDVIRDPISFRLAGIPGDLWQALYLNGLMPAEELRKAAVMPTPGRMTEHNFCAWFGWHRRDPDAALQAALAVPTVRDIDHGFSAYDFSAGWLIGRAGSRTEVRRHLLGSYSRELIWGLDVGIMPLQDTYMDEIETLVKFRVGSFREWETLSHDATRAEAIVEKLIQQPSRMNNENLEVSHQFWDVLNRERLLRLAFSSGDTEVRKIGLEYMRLENVPKELIPRIVESAEGRLEHGDADEQRLAATVLADYQIPTLHWAWTSGWDRSNPVTPLTASEKDQIDTICAPLHETTAKR